MKKLLRLLIIITFFGLLLIILNSFGLFETEGIGVVNQSTGKWIIKINDVDITNEQNLKFSINNFIYEKNDKVADNKIAPNGSGYFDLIIDPTGTDVSVRYDISFDFSIADNIPSLKIDVINNDSDIIKTSDNNYTGVIKLSDIKKGKKSNLRVKIMWENIEDNNEFDSVIGTNENSKIIIPIKVKAIQYTGEDIC